MKVSESPTRLAEQLSARPVHKSARGGRRVRSGLEESARILSEVSAQLLEEVATGRGLTPAGTCLTDHGALLRSHLRELRNSLPQSYFRMLPAVAEGPRAGDPRIFDVAVELVRSSDGELQFPVLRDFLMAYRPAEPVLVRELWALEPLLRAALIEMIADAAAGDLASEAAERMITNGVAALQTLDTISWPDLVESVSEVERALRLDPAGIYAGMELRSRDQYRHVVEDIARHSGCTEGDIARTAIELSAAASSERGKDALEAHVGYFLCGDGLPQLERRAGWRAPLIARLRRHPNAFYFGGSLVFFAAVMEGLARWTGAPWWFLLLAAIPASQVALAAMNMLATLAFQPRRLPRLDFGEGIPDDCRAFVVVPALLLSKPSVERLLENLEIHYLANSDPNLSFALLTDFPDSRTPGSNTDLLDACASGIRALNRRYRSNGREPFYLFHRRSHWNECESTWMGHERKRGKLNDFNELLLGEGDWFDTKVGDLGALAGIRYVITLDSDTQLPRDTASKLIGTMAHPLNRPVLDPVTRTVRKGYALLQPRIGINMESARRSLLAHIYSGQTGFDPYSTAVSDVYQDVFGRASFTGKGIYDLRAFHEAMRDRFPKNSLLSHDLIEGEHVRTGLVTDLDMVDDYPAKYQTYSKRKHRWVRGDWQTLWWLLPRVPDASWRWVRNPLPLLSRWKIFDNLRRSLLEIAWFLLIVSAVFVPAGAGACALAALVLMVLPLYSEIAAAFLRLPPMRFFRPFLREVGFQFGLGHVHALLNLVFLPHQALLMTDAVVRTLVRRFLTHRHLLEWESMAQTEASGSRRPGFVEMYLVAAVILAIVLSFVLPEVGVVPSLTGLSLALWCASPAAMFWLNQRPPVRTGHAVDTGFLRDVSLRTWRYFVDFCRPQDNWLVPDNVQEDPPAIARRTSPTNLGLQLTANLAAHDFGYLTQQGFSIRTGHVLATMERMERYRGHFYNWYSTRTLLPLDPPYVSTVDSGNLAASLITLKQGCLEMLDAPLISNTTFAGIRDHCLRLKRIVPHEFQSGPLMLHLSSLLRELDARPTNLFFWAGSLGECRASVQRIGEHLQWVSGRPEVGQDLAAEIRYWFGALSRRVDVALRDLCELAPWLADPFETDLRVCAGDPTLAEINAALGRVPTLRQLGQQYDAIERRIMRRLESDLNPYTRRILEGVLPQLDVARRDARELVDSLERNAAIASRWVDEMEFGFLFDERRKLLVIGHDTAAGKNDGSHYGLLASEARTAAFLAVAKGDIPRDAWFRLGRKLTSYRGQRTLISWSGTMFEYLMPAIYMKTYRGTLLDESMTAVVRIQQMHGAHWGVPWGISEAAFAARDHALNYQYQAFGLSLVSTKRFDQQLVVAPYAAMLAAMVDVSAAAGNLRSMEKLGWTGRYGFFESADFTSNPRRPEIVRAFMIHHQGMGLMALDNALLNGRMQQRFHAERAVMATEYLLQERLPGLLTVEEETTVLPEIGPPLADQAAASTALIDPATQLGNISLSNP